LDSQDSSRPELGGSHHLPPNSILCGWPWVQHPNGLLSQDSQVGILKFPQLGFLQLWGSITLRADLWLKWCIKKSCSPRWEHSNSMWHATFTWRNLGDYWFLVIGSQIDKLTLGPSFGHNLCFKCPNGSCEPIWDIYVPKDFNGIRNSSIHWVLFPEIIFWKFGSPPGLQLLKWELFWECESLFLHTLLHSWEHEMWPPSFLLARPLASPCFGHEPKAKVATMGPNVEVGGTCDLIVGLGHSTYVESCNDHLMCLL
jgi:hypothetical protein